MSFNEVLAELPGLSISERQLLVRRALELDDSMPTVEDETLIAQRLTDHKQNPRSAISLDEMKSRLRERFTQ